MTWEMENGFTTADVCRVTGASLRQINYWDTNGIVRPSIVAANGSGTVRRYSRRDVAVLAAVKKLSGHGMGVMRLLNIQNVIKEIRTDLEDTYVIVDGPNVVCAQGTDVLMEFVYEAAERGRVATVVALPDVDHLIARNL